MKYITTFANHSAYNSAKAGLALPNVSHCVQENEVHYAPATPPAPQHEYVDLGLPSGTLWATMNVGANSVTDYGNYYKYGMGSKTYDSTDTPYAGTENPLAATADTATVEWGSDWHMPTQAQLNELTANTTYQWVTNYQGSGVNGGTFTANGQTLFIPAAGFYFNGSLSYIGEGGNIWSSTPDGSSGAYGLGFDHVGSGMGSGGRDDGGSVRPVKDGE